MTAYVCNDCPRRCGALRTSSKGGGFCRCPSLPVVSLFTPHFGEEPCISGTRGSGAVFFEGCNLGCVFCQNHLISRGFKGKPLEINELCDIFLQLQDKGVHNINLVTGGHYIRAVAEALSKVKLNIPVVWNSSGYESVESLKMLEGLVDIYLPDYKYSDGALAKKYSHAPDYPEVAKAAIFEMYRQVGSNEFDENDMMKKGMVIRHLILPEAVENSMEVIDFVAESFPSGDVGFSLMSQYTPMPGVGEKYNELSKPIDRTTAEHLLRYAEKCGIKNGFYQDLTASGEEMIPKFL